MLQSRCTLSLLLNAISLSQLSRTYGVSNHWSRHRTARELVEKASRPEQVKQFAKLLTLLLRSLDVNSTATSIHPFRLIHEEQAD
jgi:hypothetical protein